MSRRKKVALLIALGSTLFLMMCSTSSLTAQTLTTLTVSNTYYANAYFDNSDGDCTRTQANVEVWLQRKTWGRIDWEITQTDTCTSTLMGYVKLVFGRLAPSEFQIDPAFTTVTLTTTGQMTDLVDSTTDTIKLNIVWTATGVPNNQATLTTSFGGVSATGVGFTKPAVASGSVSFRQASFTEQAQTALLAFFKSAKLTIVQ
jgi:hypothetical protein